jgi:hypothetical protein
MLLARLLWLLVMLVAASTAEAGDSDVLED